MTSQRERFFACIGSVFFVGNLDSAGRDEDWQFNEAGHVRSFNDALKYRTWTCCLSSARIYSHIYSEIKAALANTRSIRQNVTHPASLARTSGCETDGEVQRSMRSLLSFLQGLSWSLARRYINLSQMYSHTMKIPKKSCFMYNIIAIKMWFLMNCNGSFSLKREKNLTFHLIAHFLENSRKTIFSSGCFFLCSWRHVWTKNAYAVIRPLGFESFPLGILSRCRLWALFCWRLFCGICCIGCWNPSRRSTMQNAAAWNNEKKKPC